MGNNFIGNEPGGKLEHIFCRSDGVKLELLYEPYCEICGKPIPNSFAEYNPYCVDCNNYENKNTPLLRVRAFGKYFKTDESQDTLSREIRSLKTDITVLPRLQECLNYSMENQYPELQDLDIVIPVMRGSEDASYNQSELLAKHVADRYNKPVMDVLFKKEQYRPLHEVHDYLGKKREITGKIGCNHEFNGESILLIDDTSITMATKNECARILKENGAGEIWALVLGRFVDRAHLDFLKRRND